MQCSACGVDTPEEAIFCPKCGHNLNGDGIQPAPQPTAEDPPAGSEDSGSTAAQRFRNSVTDSRDDSVEEEVSLWKGGYSAKAMIGGWVLAGIATLVLIVATVFFPGAWFVLVPLMFLAWICAALVLAYRKLGVAYELTSQRFIHRAGVLKRTSDRLEVIDIDDVTYSQGLIQRMFNVGSIRITSSDRSHPELLLIGIENVRVVADSIDDVRRKERRKRGLHIESI